MNKLMTVVAASVCAVSLSSVAVAEEPAQKNQAEGAAEAAGLEEEETAIFEAGVDFDFFSAYVWRNAVQTDDMVMQPCVWGDLTYFEPFWLGFSIWQNYDLTDRRRSVYTYGVNETDYNVHLGVTPWEDEEGEMSLGLELGHDWYTYHGVKEGARNAYPDTQEVYVKATFSNPLVNVYGMASWMYRDFGDYQQGMHYEIGFNKEVEVVESVVAGVDWNVNFGDPHYLSFLYGSTDIELDDEGEWADCGNPSGGIGGTTLKGYVTWSVTDNLSLGGTVAYTGVLNGKCRSALGDFDCNGDWWGDGSNDMYPRDLFWGGVSLKLAF